jgi:hypothetical protein
MIGEGGYPVRCRRHAAGRSSGNQGVFKIFAVDVGRSSPGLSRNMPDKANSMLALPNHTPSVRSALDINRNANMVVQILFINAPDRARDSIPGRSLPDRRRHRSLAHRCIAESIRALFPHLNRELWRRAEFAAPRYAG